MGNRRNRVCVGRNANQQSLNPRRHGYYLKQGKRHGTESVRARAATAPSCQPNAAVTVAPRECLAHRSQATASVRQTAPDQCLEV